MNIARPSTPPRRDHHGWESWRVAASVNSSGSYIFKVIRCIGGPSSPLMRPNLVIWSYLLSGTPLHHASRPPTLYRSLCNQFGPPEMR